MRNHAWLPAVVGFALAWSTAGFGHNNPDFKEVLLTTVEVAASPDEQGRYSAPFAIAEWPAKTIEYVWRVEGADGASFAVSQGGEVVADDLTDGARSSRLKGEGFAIVEVTDAEAPFTVNVFANVIDRSSPSG